MPRISVFFDTNVLVYAHDELSTHHEKSAALLDLALDKAIHGIVSEQNIFELYRVLTNAVAMKGRPLSSAQVTSLVEETYLSGIIRVVYPTRETLKIALDIAQRTYLSSAKIFDARLYAQALLYSPTYFLTYDTEDFKHFGELTLKTPDDLV